MTERNIQLRMKNTHKIILLFFLIGSFAASAQTVSLKVLSMNIREGGSVVDYNADPLCEFIREQNPDFVAFQEVDNFTTRNTNKDLLTEMGLKLGMFPYYGKAFDYRGGAFGVALLSKCPFFFAQTIVSKPAGATENRACAYVDVMLPNGRIVRMGTTHLDVAPDDQVRISSLANFNKVLLDEDNPIPTLLIGDFNASPTSDTMKYAKTKWQDIGDGTGNTFSSTNATARIDYVMGFPKTWIRKSYEIVCRPDLSDHCFIVAEIEQP